jgi:hypothetical protein
LAHVEQLSRPRNVSRAVECQQDTKQIQVQGRLAGLYRFNRYSPPPQRIAR